MKVKIVIPSSEEFAQKGNGRIFVQSRDEIKKVHEIIKKIDKSEYEGYMPKELVTVFDKNSNDLVYTHKFDINIEELISKCTEQDIYILVYSCNSYRYDDTLTLESAIERELGITGLSDFTYNKTKDW